MPVDLFQVYYKEEHKNKLFPFAKPYFNEGLTIFFESELIRKLVMGSKADKIGITSWKLRDKLRRNVGLGKTLTENDINGDYQVLSLTRNSKKHQMLAHLYQWHPKSKEAMSLLWSKLGYKLPGEAKNPIYQNAFCAKTEIYRDYVENFLSPAMELTLKDEELNNLMLQPSGYGRLSKEADLKSVKAKLGMSDYPLVPFVLERCFCLFAQVKGYQISYL
jgi:hypothetical protein